MVKEVTSTDPDLTKEILGHCYDVLQCTDRAAKNIIQLLKETPDDIVISTMMAQIFAQCLHILEVVERTRDEKVAEELLPSFLWKYQKLSGKDIIH